jgi:catechol 2,3-dioxygenase-like lactoylglutathione lyase family enzyme
MKILFCSGFSPLVRDPDASMRFYRDTLGIPLRDENDGYPRTDALEGLKHFGLWSLADAAESCFGTREWPAHVPVPQAGIEFDVEDSDEAIRELQGSGLRAPGRRARRAVGTDGDAPAQPGRSPRRHRHHALDALSARSIGPVSMTANVRCRERPRIPSDPDRGRHRRTRR